MSDFKDGLFLMKMLFSSSTNLIAEMMSCLLRFVCLPASCLPVCCPNYMHLPTQQPTKRGQHVYVSFSAHQKNKQSHLFFRHCESGLALLCCFFTLSKKNETLHLPLFLTTSVFSNKVNRCLERYSPRATTTNQMSRQGLAQNEQKCHFWAKFGFFCAKNPNFYWRNQKFCHPHNGKPT